MVCADYDDYVATAERAAELYGDRREWSRRSLLNVAGASGFSSDETIRRYACEIWGLRPVPVDAGLTAGDR
jgi:starch phosphorylase